MLGMNRCIAICYYGTRARTLNRVFVAIGTSALTWVLGIAMGNLLLITIVKYLIAQLSRFLWIYVSYVCWYSKRFMEHQLSAG